MFSGNIILSTYQNPPYRTPASRTSTTPPTELSPKRKFDDFQREFQRAITPLEVERTSDENVLSGADSPRTKVAERFNDLGLHQGHSHPSYSSSDGHGSPRKRVRRSLDWLATPPSSFEVSTKTPPRLGSAQEGPSSSPAIEETPDCRRWRAGGSPSPRSSTLERRPNPQSQISTWPGISAPPPAPPSTPVVPSTALQPPLLLPDRAMSPLPMSTDLQPDQAALTWQDEEITGHDVDASGDDDGEGINGIGFRPTPAMAYTRQQKRRQQVSEWRAREAREARQRRFERRRGSKGDGEQHGDAAMARRMVRFAEVG